MLVCKKPRDNHFNDDIFGIHGICRLIDKKYVNIVTWVLLLKIIAKVFIFIFKFDFLQFD